MGKNFMLRVGELATRIGAVIDQYRDEQKAERATTPAEETTTKRKLGKARSLRWFLPNGGTLLMIVLLIATQSVWARSTQNAASSSSSTISYQGRLADSGGTPLTGFHNLEFRIYDVPTGGVPLWEELWTGGNSVQVSDGLFNVMLGSINNTLASTIQGYDELYLGITVGTDSEMVPRVQLGSVPFSMQALTVPDSSVTAAKISDGAVTKEKLATGLFSTFYTTTSIENEWAIPVCNGLDVDSSYHTIPGLSLSIDLSQDSTLFIDTDGIAGTAEAGKATYTNIFVNGTRTLDSHGKALITGCRNGLADGSGNTKWCTFSNSVAVDLPAGSHTVDVRALCDGTSGNVHNGILRAIVIP